MKIFSPFSKAIKRFAALIPILALTAQLTLMPSQGNAGNAGASAIGGQTRLIPNQVNTGASAMDGQTTAGLAQVVPLSSQHLLTQPPALSLERLRGLEEEESENEQAHLDPLTPVDPTASVRSSLPSIPSTAPPVRRGDTESASAGVSSASVGDFIIFELTDLGSGTANLIPEPSVASNGNGVLETWNWYAGVSTNAGATFGYFDPYSLFPASYGGFCCDQVAYYEPSRDLFIWILQYSTDINGTNELRLAVAQGQSNLAVGNFYWWDLTPQQLGSPIGTNYDQPKAAASNNYFYIEVTQYGAASGSVVMRFALDTLAAAGSLPYQYYYPNLFSPGFTQGAKSTMYFAAHVSTSTLRVFSWPESVSSTGITTTDVSHSSYPQNFPYTCPRTGGSATSDWCQRRSFGGGWAHSDRIFSGWVTKGVIGFAWDASQGTAGLGTCNYPYEHIVVLNQNTKALLSQPIIWNSAFAWEYFAISPNAGGEIAGTYIWGGGTYYENCGAFIWDSKGTILNSSGLTYSDSDPNDELSGDYLATRMNGGHSYTWSGTCYALQGGGASTNIHPYYVSFGRQRGAYLPLLRR